MNTRTALDRQPQADPHTCVGTGQRPVPAAGRARIRYRPDHGTKAERHAARERASPCHHSQPAALPRHAAAATHRYRASAIDAHAIDQTTHHHHRATGNPGKFSFTRSGETHATLLAGPPDRITADTEPINWQQRAAPPPGH
jgi:hypothetical protein